jgi:hypothetical protein
MTDECLKNAAEALRSRAPHLKVFPESLLFDEDLECCLDFLGSVACASEGFNTMSEAAACLRDAVFELCGVRLSENTAAQRSLFVRAETY